MLCTTCRQCLEGIWDPSKTKRVCQVKDLVTILDNDDSNSHGSPSAIASHADEHPSQHVFGHHPSPESYMQSLAQSCIICSGPWHQVEQIDLDRVVASQGYHSVFTIDIQKTKSVMEIFRPGARTGARTLPFFEGSVRDYNLDIGPSTGDAATWALIRSWVDTCTQSHKRCNQESNYLPQHLLQLDRPNGLFQLIPTAQLDPDSDVRYCTLSHCYSAHGDDSHQPTSSAPKVLSGPQPLSGLPLAYQHAFEVISQLGVRYLWIDHLCVIQDGPLTNRERRDILSNGFCGIGATGSTSPSSGLFTERTPELNLPTLLEFPLSIDGDTTMVRFDNPNARRFRDEPLIKTAKGFQERLLTPRMIHFTSSLIYWECYGALCSEVNPRNMVLLPESYKVPAKHTMPDSEIAPTPSQSPAVPAWKQLIMVQPPPYQDADDRDVILDSWFNLLQAYTRCSHNEPEERLGCVESAAMDTKALLKKHGHDDVYLAGMWKNSLPTALVWTVEAAADDRPIQQQGPSWSWSTVNGAIVYDHRKMQQSKNESLCELIDAKYDGATVTAGSLILRGKLAMGKLRPGNHSDWTENGLMPEDVLKTRYGAQMSIVELVDPTAGTSLGRAPDDIDDLHEWCIRFDTKHDMKHEVFMLPVSLVPAEDRSLGVTVYGIALTKTAGEVYARTGMWEISLPSEEKGREVFKDVADSEITIV